MIMRVCHIADTLPGSHKKWGGAEQVAIKTIEALQKAGVENAVLCLSPEKWDKNYPFFGIKTLENIFGWRIASAMRSIFPFDWIAYFEIKKYLRKIKPDIVHIHKVAELSLASVLAAKSLGIKVVVAIYDYEYFCPKGILVKKDGS